jgi:hypothetical protein
VIRTPYPGYDPMRESDHWDPQTQRVVQGRLANVPTITFFTPDEVAVLEAVIARVLPQDDRPANDRVPIAPFLDQMLAQDDTDGFRQPDMPWAQELWRRGLAGVEEASQAMHGRGFGELGDADRDAVLTRLQAGDPPGTMWTDLSAQKFFKQLVQQIATVYYAHPTAWSEIGWGGPASPRGYVRTGYGMRDPWEAQERGKASSIEIVQQRTSSKDTASGAGGATH